MTFAVPFKRNSNNDDDAAKEPSLPPYTPPEDWTGLPSQAFWLEIVRQGVDLGRIDLPMTREFLFIGRVPLCDLVLDHASISRFHAILQFDRRRAADGFAIYDLGSTHGTFVNKERILPHTHIHLNIGDFVRFGESLRVYVVGGGICEAKEAAVMAVGTAPAKSNNLAVRLVRRWIEEFEVDLEITREQVASALWETQLVIRSLSEIFGDGGGEDTLRCAGRASSKKESEAAAMANLYEILLQQGYLREPDNDHDYDVEEERGESLKKKPTVETFQSLSAKHRELSDRIGSIERAMAERHKAQDDYNNVTDPDDLDRIMAELKANEAKADLIKLQAELDTLTAELGLVSRLLEIARPTTSLRVLDRLFLPASRPTERRKEDRSSEVELYDRANEEWNVS